MEPDRVSARRTAALAFLPALASVLTFFPRSALAQEEPTAPLPFAPKAAVAPASPDFPEETLPTKVADVPGTWDLSRDGTSRRCVMTLMRDRGPAGQKLNFPAGCRRALPVVNGVVGWLYADEAVRLVDANIRPVLLFKRRPDRRSYVATEKGETYSLVPLDIVGMRPPGAPPPQGEAAVNTAVPQLDEPAASPKPSLAPVPAALPSATGPQPGTYALDRFRQQGTCRLALESGGTVKLLPGCQDEGIEVFNPVQWRYADGHMTVTAKRGHTIRLVPTGDGRWRRDPELGATLVLRREP